MARAMGITPSSEEWEDIWERTLDLGLQTSDPIPTRRSSGFDHYCSTSCCRREGFAAYFLHRKSHDLGCDRVEKARPGWPRDRRRDAGATVEREVSDARMI